MRWRRPTPTSSPSTRTCTTRRWRPSARCRRRPCCTRPPTTSRRCTSRCSGAPSATPTAFCFHTAAERTLVERMYPVADKPQIVLGLGVGESQGAGRSGAEILGLGDRPYIVSVGRVDEHKGSKMLARFFATYKERNPGPLALALVGPVSFDLEPHPDIVVTGAVSRAGQVGHRPRLAGGGVALGARVVLPRRRRGLGGPGPGAGERVLRPDPGARRAVGRRPVVHLVSRVRGRARPAGGRPRPAGRAGAAGAGLRGHATSSGRC